MHTLSSSPPALEKDNGSWTKRLFICACCARSQRLFLPTYLSIYLSLCTLNFFYVLSCIYGMILSNNLFSGEVPSIKSSTFKIIYQTCEIPSLPQLANVLWFSKVRVVIFISHALTKFNFMNIYVHLAWSDHYLSSY